MAAFLTVVRIELLRRLRDPIALLVWLAIPFMLIAILAAVFGGRGETGIPKIPVLVVDHDGGVAARLVSGALTSPGLARILDARTATPEEAERAMGRGDVSLVLEIPEGFTRAMLDGEPVTLTVLRNPSESILPGVGEDVVRFLAHDASLLRALVAPLIEEVAGKDRSTAPTLQQVQTLSTRIYGILSQETARNLLRADAVTVVRKLPSSHTRSRSEVIGWFAPGFVALALLFMASGQSQEIQEDVVTGRLQRSLSWPRPLAFTVAAKGTALVLSVAIAGTILELLLAAVLGWRPGHPAGLLLHTAATALAFSGLALLLRSLTRNPEAGGAAASGILVGLGFLGGCFVPTVMLPAVVRATARWIPTGWAVDGFIALQGSGWAGAVGSPAVHSALLGVFGILCFLAASRLLERQVVR